jgi:hypothetical protein
MNSKNATFKQKTYQTQKRTMKNIMNRRQAVQRMALAIGGTLVAPNIILESSAFDPLTSTAAPERLALLDAIAETIIPRTATSGARDAQVGAFIDVMIRDCYYPDWQEKLNAGIQEIAVKGRKALGRSFAKASQLERESFLRTLDEIAHKDDGHYFRTLKELTLLGYFTSEPGLTENLNYEPVPTRFEPCAPADEHTKIMVTKL